MMLEHIGFDVTEANRGRLGLELFARRKPRFPVVVLDWLMPGLSGEQVLKELRAQEPTLPVILVSGYSALDFGADDPYAVRLQKPMTLEQLRDAVRISVGETANRLRS
jgi:DNA-binding response OmpR family regulator